MTDFKKGDTVVLKSGGPAMTVQDIGDYSGFALGPKNGVKCIWFDSTKSDAKVHERVFDADTLDIY